MTTARDRQDAFRAERRLVDLERATRQIPSRWKASSAQQATTLVILNGNSIGNGAKGILFASTVTLASLPDISATTDVADGLGRAHLYVDGVLSGAVWVRHANQDDANPLQAGARRSATSTVSISYGAGSITAYHWRP
jgi:hypothetical protein